MVGLVVAIVAGGVKIVGALRGGMTQTAPREPSAVSGELGGPPGAADVMASRLALRAASDAAEAQTAARDVASQDGDERSPVVSAHAAVLPRDDERVAYIVLFFGFLGIAAGAVIGSIILATATPPRIDLGKVGLDTIYSVLCLAAPASSCPLSTRPAGLGAGLLWFSGLVIVSWTGGGLATYAWEKAARFLVRPTRVQAENLVDAGAAAIAVLVPALIAAYFIVAVPNLLGRVALVAIVGWVGAFVWDVLMARGDRTHLGALARRSPGVTAHRYPRRSGEAEPATLNRSWIHRPAAIATFLVGGGVVASTVMSIAGIADHGSTVLTYAVLVGGPLMVIIWIVEEALQPGRSRNARIGAAVVSAFLLALGVYALIGLLDGSWTYYLSLAFAS
jgi:hypothetical protein